MGNPKGNKAEREVAALLKGWWSAVESHAEDGSVVEFVRTPMSGGWVYGPTFRASGDIMTNAHRFPFSVEVKRREAWSLQVLLDGKPSKVWGYWRQCQRDAEKVSLEPMMWFRQNRKPWMVMLRRAYMKRFDEISPDVIYSRALCLRVDCGEIPVICLASTLFGADPHTFALPPK